MLKTTSQVRLISFDILQFFDGTLPNQLFPFYSALMQKGRERLIMKLPKSLYCTRAHNGRGFYSKIIFWLLGAANIQELLLFKKYFFKVLFAATKLWSFLPCIFPHYLFKIKVFPRSLFRIKQGSISWDH